MDTGKDMVPLANSMLPCLRALPLQGHLHGCQYVAVLLKVAVDVTVRLLMYVKLPDHLLSRCLI